MRTFLAIPVPTDVKARLALAVKRLAPEASDVVWDVPAHLHVTLAFLGESSPAIFPHVVTAVTRVCGNFRPLSCRAYGFGFFGSKRNPKVIWAGIDPTPELEAFYEETWKELKRFGFKMPEDAFRPHVTLGRCKEAAKNGNLIRIMEADEEIAFGQWDASEVYLYESRPSPRGRIYRILNKLPFVGS